MTRRGNNGGEATADTSGESLGSELALRADRASVSASRFTSSCQGRVLADPGQPPDGGSYYRRKHSLSPLSSPSIERPVPASSPSNTVPSYLPGPAIPTERATPVSTTPIQEQGQEVVPRRARRRTEEEEDRKSYQGFDVNRQQVKSTSDARSGVTIIIQDTATGGVLGGRPSGDPGASTPTEPPTGGAKIIVETPAPNKVSTPCAYNFPSNFPPAMKPPECR
jgi:hypothetical protein